MEFIRNFPFFSILLSLGSGVLTSIMNKKVARLWNTFILVAITAMSGVLFVYMLGVGEPYTFMMGHFPAPWGNEIRAGVLEAGMALFFCIVMLLSLKGGEEHIDPLPDPVGGERVSLREPQRRALQNRSYM